MIDGSRLFTLYESLNIGDCVATPDAERDGLYRHIYFFADGDEAIYRDMLGMLREGIQIVEVYAMKLKMAVARVDSRIIMCYQDADWGFMLYLDEHKHLMGEIVQMFDVLKILRSEV